MTFAEVLADLAEKTDPCQANCLRCCARLRLVLRLMAAAPLPQVTAIQWEDEDIDAEVALILEEYPDLVGRFEPCGTPRGTACGHSVPAPLNGDGVQSVKIFATSDLVTSFE
jgi:hypothetical protein